MKIDGDTKDPGSRRWASLGSGRDTDPQPTGVASKKRSGNKNSRSQATPLFQDTSTPQPGNAGPSGSGGYPPNTYNPQQASQGYEQGSFGNPQAPEMLFPGQQFVNDPMASMAIGYGTSLAGQGKDYLDKHLESYVSTSKIKYYFAVDTTYVGKKLGLLLFPYSHSDWSLKYNQDQPVAPRYEVNAPDLYIPLMAFVTYILVAGVVLGTQNRFTPEQLGILASTASVWLIIELLAILLSLYVMNVKTDLKYLDILAYCGYKFVGMIVCLAGGFLFQSLGFFISLVWCSLSIAFFLVRTLRVQILPHSSEDSYQRGSKRCLYLILSIAGFQPALIWWLCRTVLFG